MDPPLPVPDGVGMYFGAVPEFRGGGAPCVTRGFPGAGGVAGGAGTLKGTTLPPLGAGIADGTTEPGFGGMT